MSNHPRGQPGNDAAWPGTPVDGAVGAGRVPFVLAALSGLAFALFPLIRPWGDKAGNPEAMAQAFADPLWVYSHLSGMIGWVLLAAAVVAAGRWPVSAGAAWLLGLGVAAVLPYYGAETFALHVIGGEALAQGNVSMVEMESLIRAEPVATVLFGLGLLLAAVGAVLVAVGTWKRGHIRWAAIPLAVLVSLYLPQFFAPDAARIVHGILLGIACVLWGAVTARR